jgi:hypothetical protein
MRASNDREWALPLAAELGDLAVRKLCADCRRVKIWRVFWRDGAELPPRLIDDCQGSLRLHRRPSPNAGKSCSGMWEKEIV